MGIVIVVGCQPPDSVLLHVLDFQFCPFHRLIPVFQGFYQTGGTIPHDLPDIHPMLINLLGTTHCPIQFQRLLEVEVRQARERHRIK